MKPHGAGAIRRGGQLALAPGRAVDILSEPEIEQRRRGPEKAVDPALREDNHPSEPEWVSTAGDRDLTPSDGPEQNSRLSVTRGQSKTP